jgi:hypothetical protein
MTRAEFIQRAVLVGWKAWSTDESIERAVRFADLLEQSGKAPWDDEKQRRLRATPKAR